MKTKNLILVLVLALLLAIVGATLANSSIERPRWVLSSGAFSTTGSGGTTLRATLGQPVVGVVTAGSGKVTLGQGFWHGVLTGHNIYLPLVIRE